LFAGAQTIEVAGLSLSGEDVGEPDVVDDERRLRRKIVEQSPLSQRQLVRSTPAASPTDRLLTGALLVAPLIYLAADSTYAARGWDDGTAGVIHVLGAIAYGFVILRVASWLPATSKLAAAILVTGLIGLFFPLSFALVSVALVKFGHRWQAALVLVAMIAWPVAHIGDVAALAVLVNVALVLALGSLAWSHGPSL
jgi:hypothetical protein